MFFICLQRAEYKHYNTERQRTFSS